MGSDVTRCDRQDGKDSGASSVPEEDYYHGPWATPHAHGGFPNENVWGIPTFLAISAIDLPLENFLFLQLLPIPAFAKRT